jgi:hypothetical protein
MRRQFDIFEKFPDGSTVWRICVRGRYETERKLLSLAEHSENEFYAIEVPSGAYVTANEIHRNSLANDRHDYFVMKSGSQ